MDHSDRQLVCNTCGSAFVFTGREQAYFAQHAFQEPRRCKPCRALRKAGAGSTEARGNGPGNAGGGRAPRRAPPAPRAVAADDPYGYRAPGFRSDGRTTHVIDYAGLPRDVEDGTQPTAPPDGVDRFGMRTDVTPGRGNWRGSNPQHRVDRAGTDPNAYRSPSFREAAPPARREGNGNAAPGARGPSARATRNRFHDATCLDCGAPASVPFQPSAERPAYCKNCYQARRAAGTAPGRAPRTQDGEIPQPVVDGAAE